MKTYQAVCCVSSASSKGALLSSVAGRQYSGSSEARKHTGRDLLISAMVMTPAALELVLLWPFSFGGDDDRPWTAESTLVRGSDMVVAVRCCRDQYGSKSWSDCVRRDAEIKRRAKAQLLTG